MAQSKTQQGIAWTSGIERLWLALEAMDPDWLRLTHSLKTVLAVVLTMGIIYPIAPDNLFFSAIGAGFLMQCAEGASRRQQRTTFIICAASLMLLAVIGAGVSSHREVREALVVIIAFLTFYLRRFISRRPGFTAYGFVVYILATVLPGGGAQAITHVEALAVSSLVAFSVFFLIRPPNPIRAFAKGTEVFCSSVADMLRVLGQPGEPQLTAKYEHQVKRALRFNQALADSLLPGPDTAQTDELLVGQYDAWQSLQMLQDSLARLTRADAERLPVVWSALEHGLQGLAMAFDQPSVDGPSTKDQSMNALQVELLRSSGPPDRSWVYFGGVVLAGRRLEAQAHQLADNLKSPVGQGKP